jgi:FlaA1/EpsC-like NDP-sugar epimerase
MIRLSGLQEGVDINIEFSGVRPGEKLYEEMFFSHEVAEATGHPKILRAKSGLEQYCGDEAIAELIQMARNGADERTLRTILRRLVPDFADRITIMSSDHREEPRLPRVSGARSALTEADIFHGEKKRRASGQHPQLHE